MEKKNFVCIFAHPDDEAFGPGGTIHKLTRDYNIYLLCLTKGQQGQDSDFEQGGKLHNRRVHELIESAQVLGVKKVYFLGFKDGELCNNIYHDVAAKIQDKLEEIQPVEIMTFDTNGLSGHIDHIMTSYVTTYVFHKLSFIQKLWYYCLTEKMSNELGYDYFIHFPSGYKQSGIDKIIDVSDVWDTKVKAMVAHKSQKHDAERILERTEDFPREECFKIEKKA